MYRLHRIRPLPLERAYTGASVTSNSFARICWSQCRFSKATNSANDKLQVVCWSIGHLQKQLLPCSLRVSLKTPPTRLGCCRSIWTERQTKNKILLNIIPPRADDFNVSSPFEMKTGERPFYLSKHLKSPPVKKQKNRSPQQSFDLVGSEQSILSPKQHKSGNSQHNSPR